MKYFYSQIIKLLSSRALFIVIAMLWGHLTFAQNMDELWGSQQSVTVKNEVNSIKGKRFREDKYAMFIHWGIYSYLGNKWNDKTYYGIGEWLMSSDLANIAVEDYVLVAKEFNPIHFDAKKVVQLAKNSGMKYIVVTAKHHDGFAMYDSKSSDFNIVKATPFKRDPMKELSIACAEAGLGFGFYYSHNQDWTSPYGTIYKTQDNLEPSSFESYFRNKCLPQVEEITSNYGPIELVWFDTPGNMKKEYITELVDIVRKNQPNALISGRAGHNLGDYQTLGDMEIPLKNVNGLWETVDVTNDAWGYAWYDHNWKTPKEILQRLISTVARGGTYMLNIGLDGQGNIPLEPEKSLLAVGKWLNAYQQVISNTEASPWEKAMPWGDITKKENKLYLSIYNWPNTNKLFLPGLKNEIKRVHLLTRTKKHTIKYTKDGDWLVLELPNKLKDPLVSVIELLIISDVEVDPTLAIDPWEISVLPVEFATVSGAEKYKKGWMEKFGEWKHVTQVSNWQEEGKATWEINVLKSGYYQVDLKYSGQDKIVWRVGQENGRFIQNQQNASSIYTWHPIGWIYFDKAGKQHITVSLVEGDKSKSSLSDIRLSAVEF